MKKRSALVVVMILCGFCISGAQERKLPEKLKYIVAPSENTLLTVASQPTCPLLIENAKVLLNIDTVWDFRFSYDLRNRGNKPIRNFSIYFWTSEGTGGTLKRKQLKFGILPPGERAVYEATDNKEVTVPLTEELRERLRLNGRMKMVVVLMVETVEFEDGSRFSDEKTLAALKTYFEAR